MTDEEFAATLMGHRPLLVRVAARVVGDEECEDAAQEASVQAWQARGRFDGRSLVGWAVAITRNGCVDLLRRRATHPATVALDARLAWRGDGPESLYLAAERDAAIRLAVARLPPGQRRAVLGYYFRGLAVRQVAALAGAATVRVQLFRARATLRRELAGWR